mmetsp:Transcript_18386/g.30431  ORF Transcript_18386/g.30431 Transcript_18386/m.30431 type:complete len:128 (-) Transcript_18386:1661-2044(-)
MPMVRKILIRPSSLPVEWRLMMEKLILRCHLLMRCFKSCSFCMPPKRHASKLRRPLLQDQAFAAEQLQAHNSTFLPVRPSPLLPLPRTPLLERPTLMQGEVPSPAVMIAGGSYLPESKHRASSGHPP